MPRFLVECKFAEKSERFALKNRCILNYSSPRIKETAENFIFLHDPADIADSMNS